MRQHKPNSIFLQNPICCTWEFNSGHIQQKAARASEYARQRSWQAQKVLNQKYQRLHIRGKHHNQVVAAVARSLVGYIWDIGCHTMEAIDNPQPQHERFQ